MTITKEQYNAALDIIMNYKAQQMERTQGLLDVISADLIAYFNEYGPKFMEDFDMCIDFHTGAIELEFFFLDDEDLDGSEPFHEAIENIAKKYDVVIRLPYCYFMK